MHHLHESGGHKRVSDPLDLELNYELPELGIEPGSPKRAAFQLLSNSPTPRLVVLNSDKYSLLLL